MKKFTLIELLVVIAIIGILTSMLMPALSKSRQKSRQVVCLSNQKNMYPAIPMFADANEDILPWSQYQYGNQEPHMWWKRQIYAYLGGSVVDPNSFGDKYTVEIGKGVFACPDDKTENTGAHAGGYGWNLAYLGWGEGGPNHHKPQNMNTVEFPVETNVVGDTSDDPDLPAWAKQMFQPPSHNGGQYIGDRHSHGINRLWLDGHATYSTRSVVLAGHNGDSNYFFKKEK